MLSNGSYRRMFRFTLHGIAVGVFAIACVLSSHAQDAPSRPEPDSYKAVAGAAGSDAERLERVAALYRAEENVPSERVLADGKTARWLSRSEASMERARRSVPDRLTALRTIDPARLSTTAKLDWRVLLSLTEAEAELGRFPSEYATPNWPQNDLRWRREALPRTSIADYRERLAWLRGTALAIDESLQQLQRGLDRGVTASKDDVVATLESLREVTPKDPLESSYVAPFARDLPVSLERAQKANLRQEAGDVYQRQIAPAYLKLLTFFESVYLPKARASDAMSTLPSGQQWYATAGGRCALAQSAVETLGDRGS